MTPRLNYARLAGEPIHAMYALGKYLDGSGLEKSLQELIKIRVSQINGCAYCLDMHTQDARRAGETEQRLHTLIAWRETPFFTPRERAALAWAEAVTRVGDGVPDAAFAEVSGQFSEAEVAALTWATIAINGWNRVAISFRAVPGTYRPGLHDQPPRPAATAGI